MKKLETQVAVIAAGPSGLAASGTSCTGRCKGYGF